MDVNLIVIFVIGVISAPFGTLVGGSSLISIPTLILMGLPVSVAIGTNRFGLNGLLSVGLFKFYQKGMVDLKIGLRICIPALLGSVFGSMLVLKINPNILMYVITLLITSILIFFIIKPEVGVEKKLHVLKKHEYVFGGISSFFIGINAGLTGAGTGVFFSYVLILIFGQTFLESTATRKIPTLISSVVTTCIFLFAGLVRFRLGISLFMGNMVGSYLGAHFSDKIGNVWIRRLFVSVVLLMVGKLLFKNSA